MLGVFLELSNMGTEATQGTDTKWPYSEVSSIPSLDLTFDRTCARGMNGAVLNLQVCPLLEGICKDRFD